MPTAAAPLLSPQEPNTKQSEDSSLDHGFAASEGDPTRAPAAATASPETQNVTGSSEGRVPDQGSPPVIPQQPAAADAP
jgi:hypothetical protein